MSDDDCILDECRFVENHRWGYAVMCLNDAHADRECPGEHHMFWLDECSRITQAAAAVTESSET